MKIGSIKNGSMKKLLALILSLCMLLSFSPFVLLASAEAGGGSESVEAGGAEGDGGETGDGPGDVAAGDDGAWGDPGSLGDGDDGVVDGGDFDDFDDSEIAATIYIDPEDAVDTEDDVQAETVSEEEATDDEEEDTDPAAAEAGADLPDPDAAPVITLNGFEYETIYLGCEYIESGYSAVDSMGKDITRLVKVTDNINIEQEGVYYVDYEVTDAYERSAKARRTVFVEEYKTPGKGPTLTLNGSGTIILHLTSGTPYREQGAKAVDTDGEDISDKVRINGQPVRDVPGTYTIIYSAVGKNGAIGTTTREVRILAPYSQAVQRRPYSFSAQGRQGAMILHTNIMATAGGVMDLRLGSIDSGMSISVQFINAANRSVAFSDVFAAAGSKQYRISEGRYELSVTVLSADENGSYQLSLLMPETTLYEFTMAEVPLAAFLPVTGDPLLLNPQAPLGTRLLTAGRSLTADRLFSAPVVVVLSLLAAAGLAAVAGVRRRKHSRH